MKYKKKLITIDLLDTRAIDDQHRPCDTIHQVAQYIGLQNVSRTYSSIQSPSPSLFTRTSMLGRCLAVQYVVTARVGRS